MTKTIIITGAGRGVGKSCAERFLKEEWSVGLIGRTPEPLSALENTYENAMALVCDVANEDAVDLAFDRFVDRIQNRDIYELKIAENFSEFIGENVDDDNMSFDDTQDIVDTYIDAVETELDKNKIKNQVRELMIEAQALEVA